jgi:hypothetical protein
LENGFERRIPKLYKVKKRILKHDKIFLPILRTIPCVFEGNVRRPQRNSHSLHNQGRNSEMLRGVPTAQSQISVYARSK